MYIDKIINETINRYINENVYNESMKDDKKYKSNKSSEESQIKNDIKKNKDIFNIAGIARELYPDHTPEGAQSQLRKKIEGETNGHHKYHLNTREINTLKRILDNA